MSRNLLRLLVRRHGLFVATSAFLLGGFQFLICAAVASVDVAGALETLMQSLPPIFQALASSQFFGGFSKSGLLAFGWAHPIAQALGAALAITLATQAVAGEAEAGTIELTLAQPLSRSTYLAAQAVFALMALAFITLAGLAGTFIGQRVYALSPFGPGPLLRFGLDYLLFQSAWFGLTLLFSTWGREAGRVALPGFLLALVSYLVHVIGSMWEAWKPLVPWTLHAYYSPQEILVHGAAVTKPLTVLFGVLAVSLAGAWWRFRQRDLP
jgi:ABC-type transport system involved in multi-copper enzyme maturation permease subunit